MTSPWVDGELITAAKMYARITAVLDALLQAQSGTVAITPSGVNVITSQTVTFATAFPTAPLVFTQYLTGTSSTVVCRTWPSSVSTTGFTMNINRDSTTATNIAWFAVVTP